MSESNATRMTTLHHQLHLALRELEKVNWHIFHLLKTLSPVRSLQPFQHSDNNPFPAPNVPPHLPYVDNPQQPKPCPKPQHDCTPQNVILHAPPPAPDPVAIPLQQPAPPIECISCIAPEKLPQAPIPDSTSASCHPTRHPQSTPTSIPNWAKPALPPPTTPMVGMVYAGNTHWPPP